VTEAVHDRPPGAAPAANLALRFLLELASLAALAYWGFDTGRSAVADVALGVGAPLLAAAVWGTFAAPKSERRLRGAALVAVQLCVLGAGVLALAVTGQPVLATLFAALVVLNTVLLHIWEGEPKP